MISVGMPQVTAQNARMNGQSVVVLAYVTAEPIQFSLEGVQPIGLMAADMGDAS
jgi:hypothetical protein